MNYAGIDVANEASALCVVDDRGGVVLERMVSTERLALLEALSGLGALRVVIESSPLAEWLASVLEEGGHEPVIVDARAAKQLLSATKKTDRRDAATLAGMARTGWYTPVHRKSASARLQRSRLQARQGVVRLHRQTRSQVRGLLRAHGIKVGKVAQGAFSDRVRELLEAYEPGLVSYIEPLLQAHDHALREERRLERLLRQHARAEPVMRQMQSVPGVGALVSQAYVATIDDPARFANGDQLADYIGLAPGVYQSGEVAFHGRISRRGDRLLRWHLVEAGHALLTWGPDCALKRWGQRLAERKGLAKAKVALARKIAILLRRLWLSGEHFQAWPEASAA